MQNQENKSQNKPNNTALRKYFSAIAISAIAIIMFTFALSMNAIDNIDYLKLMFYYSTKESELRVLEVFYILNAFLLLLYIVCHFLYIAYNTKKIKTFISILTVIFAIFIISYTVVMISGGFRLNYKKIPVSYSYLLLIMISNMLVCLNYHIVDGIIYATKSIIGYHAPTNIKITTKIKGLLLEIALIPLSAIDSYIGAIFFIFGGYHFTGFITRFLIWGKLKSTPIEEGYSYNVGASDRLVTTTTNHSITDTHGNEIARYQTTNQHIEHDDGERYVVSDQQKLVGWLSPFLIILRVASVILSLLSLFTNKIFISITVPKTKYEFKDKPFLLLDLVIFKQQTTIVKQSESQTIDKVSE